MADQNQAMLKLHTNVDLMLLILNTAILAVGTCGGPLLMRLYFINGGNRVWFSSWLQTAGWPIILIPLALAYHKRRRRDRTSAHELILMKPRLFFGATLIGVLTGVDDYLYAYGVARLPVSTASLIVASQLAFTAVFAFLLVKQRFTALSINGVFLLTVGAGALALHTSSDRTKNETSKEYLMGFSMTIGAAVLHGIVLPLVEWTYAKGKQKVTYALVLEYQTVMCFFATLVCTIGMIANNDFKVIGREAREFGVGETKYYLLVVTSGIVWQGFFLGAIGVIFCSSSLVSGVIMSVLLPVTEVLAVICFKEKFTSDKGMSLTLSLWGFASYYYGEMKAYKKLKQKRINNGTSNHDHHHHHDNNNNNKDTTTEISDVL